jgi:hypothetical protein
VPLFDQFGKKALNNFMLVYLVLEIEYLPNSSRTRKNQITNMYSLAKNSGAADED